MRIKYLLFICSVLSVFIGVVLLTKKEIPLKVITSPKMFSMIHSNQTESFRISILSNKQESYHFDPDYITQIALQTSHEQIPLSLEDIHFGNEVYQYDEPYYLVDFVVKIGFFSEAYEIELEDVELVIEYENKESINVYIGDVYYVFDSLVDEFLSLSNLSATYTDYFDKRTVSGVYLELSNKSTQSITITDIDIVGSSIHLNNDYLMVPTIDIDMFTTVEEITGVHQYSFAGYQVEKGETTIHKDNLVDLYIPLVYQGDIHYIHRFALQITYWIDDELQIMYIDDFPYMNTSIFTEAYESDFRYYTYDSYS